MRKLNVFTAFAFLILFSCFSSDKEYLKIGTNVWPGYEPLYIAREKGYLKDIPVHLVEYPSASQVIRAYRNGIINGAALTLDEVLLLKSYGFDPVVILVMDISNGSDAIVARKDIKNLKDLKGKKIGVENSALGAYVLTRALEIAGLEIDQIKVVPIEVNEHMEWFTKGKVDAVITFEPVKSKLLKKGGHVIFDSRQIPEEIVDVLVVDRSYIKKHPDTVKKVIKAWFKAVDYMKQNRKDALLIVSEREHIDIEDIKTAYSGIIIPDRDENIKLLDRSDPFLKKVAKKLLNVMEKWNLITNNSIDLDELFYSGFVKGK